MEELIDQFKKLKGFLSNIVSWRDGKINAYSSKTVMLINLHDMLQGYTGRPAQWKDVQIEVDEENHLWCMQRVKLTAWSF